MMQMYEAIKQNLTTEEWKGTIHEIEIKKLLNKAQVRI